MIPRTTTLSNHHFCMPCCCIWGAKISVTFSSTFMTSGSPWYLEMFCDKQQHTVLTRQFAATADCCVARIILHQQLPARKTERPATPCPHCAQPMHTSTQRNPVNLNGLTMGFWLMSKIACCTFGLLNPAARSGVASTFWMTSSGFRPNSENCACTLSWLKSIWLIMDIISGLMPMPCGRTDSVTRWRDKTV